MVLRLKASAWSDINRCCGLSLENLTMVSVLRRLRSNQREDTQFIKPRDINGTKFQKWQEFTVA